MRTVTIIDGIVTATGTRVTLEDGEPSTDKAFYLVEVSATVSAP